MLLYFQTESQTAYPFRRRLDIELYKVGGTIVYDQLRQNLISSLEAIK